MRTSHMHTAQSKAQHTLSRKSPINLITLNVQIIVDKYTWRILTRGLLLRRRFEFLHFMRLKCFSVQPVLFNCETHLVQVKEMIRLIKNNCSICIKQLQKDYFYSSHLKWSPLQLNVSVKNAVDFAPPKNMWITHWNEFVKQVNRQKFKKQKPNGKNEM